MRWLHSCHLWFHGRKLADAGHSDVTVTPGLARRPFYQVILVDNFFGARYFKDPFRTAGPTGITDNFNVAARHEEIPRRRIYINSRRTMDTGTPSGCRPDMFILKSHMNRGQ